MATEIRGGSNQVGTSNTQFIESPVTTINNSFNIIIVNCTECHQHQQLDAVTDSVRILDLHGQVLEPGDIVLNQGSSIFVGDGHVVRYDRSSNTVVKEKLQTGRCIVKGNPLRDGNLREFPPEERVQRALQQVGRPCPVSVFQNKILSKKDFALSALEWLTGKKL